MSLHIVIITGESGAGKSSVLKALEDLDYLAIENFPVRLLLPFLREISAMGTFDKIALVMDIRDPNFLSEFPQTLDLIKKEGYYLDVIYLSADTEVLISRFSQTRRPHPLLREFKDLREAILKEKERLASIRDYANIFLNTSQYNVHQLRHQIFTLFGREDSANRPFLHLIAFGYKYGIPSECNYIFDVRILPNPYFVPSLKPLSGESQEIRHFLMSFPVTEELLNFLVNYIKWVLPRHLEEGRKFVVVGIGCTGGRHRSPAIALMVAEKLREVIPDLDVVVTLRDVERG